MNHTQKQLTMKDMRLKFAKMQVQFARLASEVAELKKATVGEVQAQAQDIIENI